MSLAFVKERFGYKSLIDLRLWKRVNEASGKKMRKKKLVGRWFIAISCSSSSDYKKELYRSLVEVKLFLLGVLQ